ncbi:MAG: phage integrase N-terminal SAM-like domain-containing protein, partial [Gemmataceae bacterium]|nr:phage integrase N-terminal SAM-like domain-containing protein [Gemmataceae bacterium]
RRYGHSEGWAAAAADWCRRFILFQGVRHPSAMGVAEIGGFLEHVAKTEKDALGAIATARAALEFLYERVMHKAVGELPLPRPAKRAKKR